MKLIFFGGNQLSVIVLEQLINSKIRPNLIITVPDKPVGKKKILTSPPLKLAAQRLKLETIQPVSLKKDPEIIKKLKDLQPELGVVAAYAKFFNQEAINVFPKGVLVVHPSLLPKYRGASPIQTAILNNDFDTGVSIILLDEKMDHGLILAQETVKLTGKEYFQEIYEKLANLGGKLLAKTIPLWIDKQITPMAQNESKATMCKKLEWKDGKIDVNDSVEKTFAKIRALGQEPGAWIELQINSKELRILKIIRAKPVKELRIKNNELRMGPQELDKELVLKCQDGALLLEQVQPEGKRVMTGKEFLNGHRKWLTNN